MVSKKLNLIYLQGEYFSKRTDKNTQVLCVCLCLSRFLEDVKWKSSLRLLVFFLLTNSCISQLYYQLEMRPVKVKLQLSTHGLSMHVGQNPEIPLGNLVTLSTIKCNQSWSMTQRGSTSEIIGRGWCRLWFCLNYSFEVYFFPSPLFWDEAKYSPDRDTWTDSRLLLFSENTRWVLVFCLSVNRRESSCVEVQASTPALWEKTCSQCWLLASMLAVLLAVGVRAHLGLVKSLMARV